GERVRTVELGSDDQMIGRSDNWNAHWGMPLPWLKAVARVALSARTPRSFLAAGYPLQSLTLMYTTR
ncbi:MAG: hypothetical protein KDC03_01480, partial [Flavobacteriales bacterium]|nr:hypothetical protein [Flavobacteriales bacterium]